MCPFIQLNTFLSQVAAPFVDDDFYNTEEKLVKVRVKYKCTNIRLVGLFFLSDAGVTAESPLMCLKRPDIRQQCVQIHLSTSVPVDIILVPKYSRKVKTFCFLKKVHKVPLTSGSHRHGHRL